ncbi:tRNA-specific adenosine deaminase subunit tad3 [Tilletia horrida]|nr:tRNA-specific adenosine deaminase subunit tad3 [Tilletia horrida]
MSESATRDNGKAAPLFRLTRAIDPSTVPNKVRPAWVLRLPSPPGPSTMSGVQKLLKTLQREHGADPLRHVKTIRKTEEHASGRVEMDAVLAYQAESGELSSADAVLGLIRKHEPGLLEAASEGDCAGPPQLRLVDIPTTPIPTRARIAEWNALWPCVLRMTGPTLAASASEKDGATSRKQAASLTSSSASIDFVDRALDARVWTANPVRLAWAVEGFRSCVRLAREAREAGDVPVGAFVTVAFEDRAVTKPGLLPVSAHDTRSSANHPLRHAVLNAIRKVADGRAALRMQAAATAAASLSSKEQAADGDAIRAHPAAEGAALLAATAENGQDYLLNSLVLFTTHEPCAFCTMALVHSRVRQVFFLLASPGAGACCGDRGTQSCVNEGGEGGGPFALHEQAGLNHHFEVWRWQGRMSQVGVRGADEEDAHVDTSDALMDLKDLLLTGINP